MQSNCHPREKFNLTPGRKGIGARLASIDLAGKEPFSIQYYFPSNKDQERKWAEKPEQKEFHIDKVEKILAPVGPNGEKIAIASFSYYPNRTDARDAEGLLIRYHHDSERLTLIEYFNEKDQLRSSQKFYWEGTELRCKAMFDESHQPLFAKTFVYDAGNVVEEMLWGYLTGNETLYNMNPQSLWLCIPHSENGVITKRAIEGMTTDQKQILQKILHIFAVAPAEPLSRLEGISVINVYSEKDRITGRYAKEYMDNPDYDIRILPCQSSMGQCNLWIADHGFLQPTYREAWTGRITDLKQTFKFYGGSGENTH